MLCQLHYRDSFWVRPSIYFYKHGNKFRLYFWKADHNRLCFWMTNSFHTGSHAHKDRYVLFYIKKTNCHLIVLFDPRLMALQVS